jgi:hypothetical protein
MIEDAGRCVAWLGGENLERKRLNRQEARDARKRFNRRWTRMNTDKCGG